MERDLLKFAAGGCIMLALLAVSTRAASFVYDPLANGGQLPTGDGWTRSDVGVGTGSETVSGANLVVSDTDSTWASFAYRKPAVLSPHIGWQMKARVQLLADYSGNSAIGNGSIYNQLVSDGDGSDTPVGAVYGFGMTYDSTLDETRVLFRGANSVAFIPVAGRPVLDITLTKTNGASPSGRGDDPIVLEVYKGGILQGSLSSTLAGGLFADTSEYVEFGNFNGAPRGTFVLRWATWGIGETAPMPDPAGASVILLGAACMLRRRRR